MRKLAEHHPARRISRSHRLRGCSRNISRPGKREMRTYVVEFWPINPKTGYAYFPANFRSGAASEAIWNTNTKPGPYRRDHYVEGKAKPIHRHVIKRYK